MGAEGAMGLRLSDLPFGMSVCLGVGQHGVGPSLALLLHNTQCWLGPPEPQFGRDWRMGLPGLVESAHAQPKAAMQAAQRSLFLALCSGRLGRAGVILQFSDAKFCLRDACARDLHFRCFGALWIDPRSGGTGLALGGRGL